MKRLFLFPLSFSNQSARRLNSKSSERSDRDGAAQAAVVCERIREEKGKANKARYEPYRHHRVSSSSASRLCCLSVNGVGEVTTCHITRLIVRLHFALQLSAHQQELCVCGVCCCGEGEGERGEGWCIVVVTHERKQSNELPVSHSC